MPDTAFEAALKEIRSLHVEKSNGYGSSSDPYANMRRGRGWGIPDWMIGALRLEEKLQRLQNFYARGEQSGVDAQEEILDIANIGVLMLVLWKESRKDQGGDEDEI